MMLMIFVLVQILGICGVVAALEWLRARDGFDVPGKILAGLILLWPLGLPLLLMMVKVQEGGEGNEAPQEPLP